MSDHHRLDIGIKEKESKPFINKILEGWSTFYQLLKTYVDEGNSCKKRITRKKRGPSIL